jgi:hypothetical protein
MFLDVYKNGELIETLSLSASKRLYTVGRQEGVADILLTHASVSREQATITISASGSVVVTDLGSAQGTFISGKALPPKKPHALAPGRSLVFGKSTRVFKLREGGDGFVSATAAAAPPPAVSEPLTERLLALLRGQVPSSTLALRPDGFARLSEVAACSSLLAFHVPAASILELAAAPSRENILEVKSEDGEPILRALSGHAPTSRVDPNLRLRRLNIASLGGEAILYHGAKFSEWNILRAKGIGRAAAGGKTGGGGILPPIRLSTAPPAKRECDIVVVIRAAHLSESGARVWIDTAGGVAAIPAGGGDPPPLSLVVMPVGGTLGVHLFDRIYSARDGGELMSAAEIEPIRKRKEAELVAAAAAAAAATAAAAAKRRQGEEEGGEEGRGEGGKVGEGGKEGGKEELIVERYNPYLSHFGMEPAPKPSNRSAAAIGPVKKRQKGEESE